MRALVISAGAFFATVIASGQTVTEFVIAKISDHYQTSDGSTSSGDLQNQADTDAFGIFAQVQGSGLTGTYTFTPPGGSATNISTVETGSLVFANDFAYASTSALNTAYANGDYSMQINTSGGLQNITAFSLTGDAFPNVPMISGGTWSNGKLLINPTQDYTLTFTGFSGFGAGDSITLAIDGSGDSGHDDESTSAVTSFLIPAGGFVLGVGNTGSAELQFVNGIDTDTSIAGATGYTGYVTILSFQIQAIPEPSTYAAIFGALVLAGVVVRRHRRAV